MSSKTESNSDDAEDDDSMLESEIDEATLYDPSYIKVSDPEHRRLLEEVGKADLWRVVFTGAAAKMDEDSTDGNEEGGR